MENVEVLILNEKLEPLPTDTLGEIAVTGPNVMLGFVERLLVALGVGARTNVSHWGLATGTIRIQKRPQRLLSTLRANVYSAPATLASWTVTMYCPSLAV